MDTGNEKNRIFNIGLSKYTGLYQILDPGTVKLKGQNVYHIACALFGVYVCVLSATFFASGLYYWNDNIANSIVYYYTAILGLYMCYKMWIVVRRSDDAWKCLSVTRYDFTSCSFGRSGDGRAVLDRWRARSIHLTTLSTVAYSVTVVSVLAFFLVLGDATMPMTNRDGSISNYRQGIFNLYLFVSAETYNAHFKTFYLADVLFTVTVGAFFVVFDYLLMTLCLAVCGQFQMIFTAFESLAHKPLCDDSQSPAAIGDYTNENKNISNEHDLIYDELKTIIIDQQAVMEKFDEFLTIFKQVMLFQILVSSISLIILWLNFIMSFSDNLKYGASTSTILLSTTGIPSISYQIFLSCYLLEHIHNQKESINFGLYSSNWTEMNMKCRKLILLTMKLNNANQKQLKFTRTKIVNLEMFFKTMGNCYTFLSVSIQYLKAKYN